MRNFTLLLTILLLMLSVFSVSGCGSITEKITGKIAEEILEKAAGDDIEIDSSDGQLVIKNDEGQEMVLGGTQWPEGEAAKSIPVFEDGKIDYVMDTGDSASISIKETSKDKYLEYVEKLKAKGFTEDTYTAESDDTYTYFAYTADRHYVSVIFNESGDMTIVIASEQ